MESKITPGNDDISALFLSNLGVGSYLQCSAHIWVQLWCQFFHYRQAGRKAIVLQRVWRHFLRVTSSGGCVLSVCHLSTSLLIEVFILVYNKLGLSNLNITLKVMMSVVTLSFIVNRVWSTWCKKRNVKGSWQSLIMLLWPLSRWC